MKVALSIILTLVACNTTQESNPADSTHLDYFAAISKNDIGLTTPKPGEWLFDHPEDGQTLEDYKKSNTRRLTSGRAKIYLMPIGNFTKLQEEALESTRAYVEIFFQQRAVLLKAASEKMVPLSATRQRDDGNTQLLAPYILDSILKGKAPKDAIAMMAISAKDLYPKSSWNYVFGLASYADRVGVTSIYRLQNKRLDSSNFKQCLRRLLNVSSHEIGHMLSMQHCTFALCVMNGSNTLHETDLSPNRLCSNCQQKLFWNLEHDTLKRLKELSNYFKQKGLLQDYGVLQKDLKALE